MSSTSVFIFGFEIGCDTRKDAITSLPLELSWKIFSYLDDESLRTAVRIVKTWKRIVYSNKKLRGRLNMFELGLKLGSHELARFYKNNRRKLKFAKATTYLPVYQDTDRTAEKKVNNSKRGGDDLVVFTKRFKLNQ